MDDLPRVKTVSPTKAPFTLNVTWSDGSKSVADLTGLVHRSRHFGVFGNDPTAFRKVRVIAHGSGIGWENGLDYAATTLKMLADEQKPLNGKYLTGFQARHGLNAAETALVLHVAERTLRAYRASEELPAPIAISLRRMDSDPTIIAAHYRPIKRRERGRPKKIAG
jgi:hypothetical protein